MNSWLDAARDLVEDASPLQWAAQAGTAAACIALAWLVTRSVRSRYTASPHWKFGQGEFGRVVFPFLAVVLVGLAELVAGRLHQPVRLLEIARALLVALLAIRLALYILGYVLPAGVALRTAVRIFATLTWIVVALHITGLLPEVRNALDEIGFTMGKEQTRITLLLVIHALAAMAVTLTVAMWLARVTAGRILAAQSVELSTRVVAVKILNTIAIVIAVLVALPMAGIDITALSFFGGALGVGLGFGLQNVVSNFVSGLILLFERPVQTGDLIEVGPLIGEVKRIGIRSSTVRTTEGADVIVPNASLISERVVNWTFTDRQRRLDFDLGVAYGTDPDKVIAILLEAAKAQPEVLSLPEPQAFFVKFGESAIDFRLEVWCRFELLARVRSELGVELMRALREAGIEIPFPQRDVHVRTEPR
jgi:small-conductance mechanosensitive channel